MYLKYVISYVDLCSVLAIKETDGKRLGLK
jgi:hypothetical protein